MKNSKLVVRKTFLQFQAKKASFSDSDSEFCRSWPGAAGDADFDLSDSDMRAASPEHYFAKTPDQCDSPGLRAHEIPQGFVPEFVLTGLSDNEAPAASETESTNSPHSESCASGSVCGQSDISQQSDQAEDVDQLALTNVRLLEENKLLRQRLEDAARMAETVATQVGFGADTMLPPNFPMASNLGEGMQVMANPTMLSANMPMPQMSPMGNGNCFLVPMVGVPHYGMQCGVQCAPFAGPLSCLCA